MPASQAFLVQRSRVGQLSRFRAPDDPDLIAARHLLAEETLLNAIEKALAAGPPLTDDLRDRVVARLVVAA